MRTLIFLLISFLLLNVSSISFAFQKTRVVVDMAGRKVAVPQEIKRVASAYWIAINLIYAISGEDLIVASNSKPLRNKVLRKIDPHLSKVVPIGDRKGINIEALFSATPDIYITAKYLTPTERKIEESGIPVVCISAETPGELMEALRFLGDLLHRERQAKEIIQYYRSKLAYIENKISGLKPGERKKVYIVGPSLLCTAGSGYYQHYIVESAGGINVAGGIKKRGWVNVSIEDILAWNPDVVVIVPYGKASVNSILFDDRLSKVKAVRDRKVYRFPKYVAPWDFPVPESILGIMWLATKLYPGKVTFDLKEEIKFFYDKFYHYGIPDEDVGRLLRE